MASNALNPFGFSSGLLYGAASPNYAMRNGQIAYNYGSQIAYGDPVVLNSSGQIVLFAKGGTAIHGIFRGCEYYDPNIQRWSWYPAWRSPTLSATAIVTAKIEVDPHMSFMAQVSGGPAVQASVIGAPPQGPATVPPARAAEAGEIELEVVLVRLQLRRGEFHALIIERGEPESQRLAAPPRLDEHFLHQELSLAVAIAGMNDLFGALQEPLEHRELTGRHLITRREFPFFRHDGQISGPELAARDIALRGALFEQVAQAPAHRDPAAALDVSNPRGLGGLQLPPIELAAVPPLPATADDGRHLPRDRRLLRNDQSHAPLRKSGSPASPPPGPALRAALRPAAGT